MAAAYGAEPVVVDSTPSKIDFPLLNFFLPDTPTIHNHLVSPSKPSPAEAQALPGWDCTFDYLHGTCALDTAQVSLTINGISSIAQEDLAPANPTLFLALAQFVINWPAIQIDLSKHLPLLGPESAPATAQQGSEEGQR